MLKKLLFLSFMALLISSCKLHVNVSGLESELTLVEYNSGVTLTLVDNELVAFDHDFKAFEYYDVRVEKSSGQTCHLVYKTGRFTTSYSEIEVNCTPITDEFSCSTTGEPICARVDPDRACEEDEILCLDQEYIKFDNLCIANISDRNPIYVGLSECPLIIGVETYSQFTPITMIDPAIVIEEDETDPLSKDSNITILSDRTVFTENEVSVTFEHTAACSSESYQFNIEKFAIGDTSADWAIQYNRSNCATVETKTITFDLLPLRSWYYIQNGELSGSIELPGIGTYSFTSL